MMEVLATQFDQLQSKLYGWIFSREPSTLVYKKMISFVAVLQTKQMFWKISGFTIRTLQIILEV